MNITDFVAKTLPNQPVIGMTQFGSKESIPDIDKGISKIPNNLNIPPQLATRPKKFSMGAAKDSVIHHMRDVVRDLVKDGGMSPIQDAVKHFRTKQDITDLSKVKGEGIPHLLKNEGMSRIQDFAKDISTKQDITDLYKVKGEGIPHLLKNEGMHPIQDFAKDISTRNADDVLRDLVNGGVMHQKHRFEPELGLESVKRMDMERSREMQEAMDAKFEENPSGPQSMVRIGDGKHSERYKREHANTVKTKST